MDSKATRRRSQPKALPTEAAASKPDVLWLVCGDQFADSFPHAAFEALEDAKDFLRRMQDRSPQRWQWSIAALPYSGADGGFVVGSDEPGYFPVRRPPVSVRPASDLYDG